ncbi:MAG TPA: hypothetical protein VGA99_08280 [bacterium]
MSEILLSALTIGLGAFFAGLMLYSFYIVLFSKNTKTPSAKMEEEAGNKSTKAS